MNLTTGKVFKGDTSASFRITLPMWTDLNSINTRCRGRVHNINFTATDKDYEDEKVALGVHCTSMLTNVNYPFHLVTSKTVNNTASKLDDKLQDHFRKAAEHFPLQRSLPRLLLVDEAVDETDPHFELFLPPDTAFKTSSELFWPAIGFTGLPLEADDAQRSPSTAPSKWLDTIGGRQKAVVRTECYGFINDSETEPLVVRGDTMYSGASLLLFLPPNTTLPKNIQFQIDFDKNPVEYRWVHTATERTVTPENVVAGLTELMGEVADACGLSTNPLEAAEGTTPGTVVIRNRSVVGAKTRLALVFDDDTAELFGLARDMQFVFDLWTSRTVILDLPLARRDPLKGRGPVTVVASGYGDAKSFIEGGKGYATVVGVYEERKAFFSVDLGLEFQTDQTVLTLEFLDSNRKLIAFESDANVNLMLAFSRLV
jgi:hypothetical protein